MRPLPRRRTAPRAPLNKLSRLERELLTEHFGDGEAFCEAVARVRGGEPLAYVLGEWYFYGLTFKLNDACLIPRADTEHIVETAIKRVAKNGRFVDLCTGSGCIAVSILKSRPDLIGEGCDISDAALTAARENAETNGVRAVFYSLDVLSATPEKGIYDAVIANPPYIKSAVIPTLDTVQREPKAALDGGGDGLKFYREIVKRYAPSLKENGIFIFEIGYDQGEDIKTVAELNGFTCTVTKDYGGNDRVAVLCRREPDKNKACTEL